MSELELAWAAGLFEGEGTVTKNPRGYLRLAVSQNGGAEARELLVRFAHAVGLGRVTGPYDYAGRYEGGLTKKPRYTWQVVGCPAHEAFLRLSVHLTHDGAKWSKFRELAPHVRPCAKEVVV